MPRSFLVKKYLKQKYDADFKLQQEALNDPSKTSAEHALVSKLNARGGAGGSVGGAVSKLDMFNASDRSESSDKAATPYTPVRAQSGTAQPLAVRLSNGYIYDVTPTSAARGSLEGDRVAAMTPKHVIESAAVENLQPRRSVIVTNNNHPANRSPQPAAAVSDKLSELSCSSHNDICCSSSIMDALSSKDGYSSAGNASYNDSMVTYSMLSSLPSERASSSLPYDSQRHHSANPYSPSSSASSSSSYNAHIGDKAPIALVLSPPPAHTPTPSPIPAAHLTAPSPAHTPAPAHTPNPAHTPVPAHSHHSHAPAPAHSNTPRPAHSRAEALPADHPIHHPLIQQLINQRLHVPSETSQSNSSNSSSSSSSSPRDLLDSESLHYRRDSDSPHRAEDALHEEHQMDVDFKDPRYSPVEQHHYEQHLSYYHTMAEESRVDYLIETSSPDTLNQHHHHHHYASSFPLSSHTSSLTPYSPSSPTSSAHFPPSPSPSLPSTSPKLPTGISSSSTLSSSSLPAPPSPPSSTRTAPSPIPTSPSALSPPSPSDSEVNAYTYEAFLISDGRSRKRALEGEEKPTGRVRYTCNECGKDYATSSNLSRHKQTHRSLDSKNAKKCPHCDKVYVSMPALSMHILTHDLKHACNVCGKTFSRPWLLQGHMRSHTGEKPFGCAHCGKAFADRSNLRAHMQTHSAFKHFACKKCNKTFALKSYLNKHLESACLKDPMDSSNF